MQNYSLSGRRLGRQALLFPLCLVLYEFSTYIGNDMIQPGMLAVVQEFQVGNEWVPTSMTAYLAGGMFLQWLLGPLSDRIGRRPVMLTGVVWFIVTCLATLLAQTIEQFTLLRFLQGISLCFIGAVGYAAIQESFEEAVCIKITALMANVALIAPLLGPLVGAAWVHILPWEMMFVLFAVLAAISFVGLQRAMPETATRLGEKLSVKELGRDYRLVLKNLRFVAGALATGFVSLPLLAWIAQSPVIIISGEQATSYEVWHAAGADFRRADCRQPGAGAPDFAPYRALADYHGRLAYRVWPAPLRGGDGGLFPRLSVDDRRSELLRLRDWPGERRPGALNPVRQRDEQRHGFGGDGDAADADLHRRHRAQQTCLRARRQRAVQPV